MEPKVNNFEHIEKPEIVVHETDLLFIGGGMAACGAAYEAERWATPQGIKITMVDKAAVDRSGAVAMGLSAINTYVGENNADDYVRYVRNDLMGIIREDLVYDLARWVDDSVHLFEDWGLPVWKKSDEGESLDGHMANKAGKASLRDGGKPVRSGKWQIMINGESYKVIVGEAAKLSLEKNREATGVEQNLFERVFIIKVLNDKDDPTKIAGAVGFSVREHKLYIFKCKTALLAGGGCVNFFRGRATAEGQGRAWFPVWNSGSNYAMGAEAGAELVLMENRFVPARFKDGYGPVGAWFLLFKALATNGIGEDYQVTRDAESRAMFGDKYVDSLGTAMRNHMMIQDMKAGLGPIKIHTDKALTKLGETMDKKQMRHLEAEAWEDFLDMSISQAGVWAANNMAPEKVPSELMPSEPYMLGSHAGCAGLWVSGPGDFGPEEYAWGYNRMTTIKGLFTAGDGCGASGHKFSSGSHAEGRVAGKAMVAYCMDNAELGSFAETEDDLAAEVYMPMETYAKFSGYTTDPDINPNYIRPAMMQQRLQKLMDEYVGGVSTYYMTSKTMLEEGMKYMDMVKEDIPHMAAEDLHELLRVWENHHRIVAAEAHAQHILFREDTRYPGYYYRGDFMLIDDENWKCFTNSTYDAKTGKWNVFKRDYHQIIPD
ncbi:MAG: adenylyl-sulfate reductase subunit alpha [Proteobacteria bacterium]|nr:adenylyl-sulfate reductase subunit alpha [Pseudomonadota bacterium]